MASGESSSINVVAGLIYRGGRVLVCQRRAGGAFPLKWEFPGGKVEEGETDIDALKRELREELAVDVRAAVLVYRHNHRYEDGPTVSLRFYNAYDCRGEANNVIFEKISWVKLTDLKHMDFLEGDQSFIQKISSEGPSIFLRR